MMFKVIRYHIGDKPYEPGDDREADETEVSHLIGTVLERAKPEAKKAEPALKNKMEAAPANKAARASKNKRR
ncbi:MAG: hypothetical protein Unbinned3696contig1008_59 [Prokaryotic dsDNA virus sp.]|nr:MAG: hypothetical protein Unbinned3696contig1008_59 [Prokaryotic dsDNA virus sp.]|tara:strand:- start:140 stop:355 length:216 start_codon:yes stop_codon:yes gene_type:complete